MSVLTPDQRADGARFLMRLECRKSADCIAVGLISKEYARSVPWEVVDKFAAEMWKVLTDAQMVQLSESVTELSNWRPKSE